MADTVSKSWFIVFNNPVQHGYQGEPQDIIGRLINEWIGESLTRSCAMTYCVSAEGLEHVHMVCEDTKAMRFSAVKKAFPMAHLEPTKGNKEQAVDYIEKKGRFEEKGEKILYKEYYGEIKGCQGARKDLEIIETCINEGYTPKEIMAMNFGYRRYEKMIKSAYFDKRSAETKFIRDVVVFWHVGASGTGKSYVANQIIENYGLESLYFVNDYENGGFDMYNGEPVLFLDEFRGQIRYSTLLSLLDKYKVQVHARYGNVLALWNEVHIASVYPPELVYTRMVSEDSRQVDTVKQLLRRLSFVVYHYKDNGEFKRFDIPAVEYHNYESLKDKVNGCFVQIQLSEHIPFS